jgi:F420-dependent oxidoreductase-like protein
VKIGLLIEAQQDLDWDLWRNLAKSADKLGFDSLWRSDHLVALYGTMPGAATDALLALAIAAEVTDRIELGTMVASVTFRHPSALARQAAQIDALSGGRFNLGVGAGWHDGEHTEYGIDFPSIGERLDRLRETILYCRAVWSEGPKSFTGEHYRAENVHGLPRPAQDPLPILVGGSGERRTLRIVAELADEWNVTGRDLPNYTHKLDVLQRHCDAVGRDIGDIRRSIAAPFAVGADDADLAVRMEKLKLRVPTLTGDPRNPSALGDHRGPGGWFSGTPDELVDQLGRLSEQGVSRVMLQHLAHDDFSALELLAARVLPQL